MDFLGNVVKIEIKQDDVYLVLKTNNKTILEKVQKYIDKVSELSISIKQKFRKRSKDSNAYAWALIGKIAEVNNADKDEIYSIMLDRYGVYSHIIVKPQVIGKLAEEFRLIKDLGEVLVNGQQGHQLQIYFGSSTYNQEEMNRFVNRNSKRSQRYRNTDIGR